MCNKRRSRKVVVNDKTLHLDSCLVNLIVDLNNNGVTTLGACCGHFRYDKTVIIQDDDGLIKELYSGVIIPRKTRYYLTDIDGYYYLPELVPTNKYKKR